MRKNKEDIIPKFKDMSKFDINSPLNEEDVICCLLGAIVYPTLKSPGALMDLQVILNM